ncbi:MAG: ABC transporter substrate-binding protein [Pseudonocardiales bacterium]
MTVDLTDHDTLIALGITPVAMTDWFAFPEGPGPWALSVLGPERPKVLSTDTGYNFEEIASLEPDLILGVRYGPYEQTDYDRLSQIAPTVAKAAGAPRRRGRCTGRSRRAAPDPARPARPGAASTRCHQRCGPRPGRAGPAHHRCRRTRCASCPRPPPRCRCTPPRPDHRYPTHTVTTPSSARSTPRTRTPSTPSNAEALSCSPVPATLLDHGFLCKMHDLRRLQALLTSPPRHADHPAITPTAPSMTPYRQQRYITDHLSQTALSW